MDLAQFLPNFLQRYHPDTAKPIVIAVSGGADSLCLSHLLLNSGLMLIPAHYDHQLRPLSAEQALQVLSLMRSWGLETEMGSGNVRLFGKTNKLGLEEAARFCRYEFLTSIAHKHNAQAILTAHHLDDQVETILMHFLRGSGINGLTGMRPIETLPKLTEDIPIWRPLLDVSKEEILEYCEDNRIEPIEDESNQDLRFYRNRLRHELIPHIEEIQPSFRAILARNAEVIEFDRQVLEKMTELAWQNCLANEFPGKALLFKRSEWGKLDEAIQYRLLIKAADRLVPGLRDLGFLELQRARKAVDEIVPRVDFKAGILIQNQPETFLLSLGRFDLPQTQFPQIPDLTPLKLMIKKPAKLQAGWQIKAELVDKKDYDRLPPDIKQHSEHAWLNPADLEWPLVVRPPIERERWSPLGMVHKHQKMSDFFINEKIPHTARRYWPVVCSAGSILWVAGLRIAQAWRLTGDEVEVLHLELIPPA
jgi:tRNA(Ile)-lysidine synthase